MKQLNIFFNTINEKGEQLEKYKDIAGKQNRRVLHIMHFNSPMTPSLVHHYYCEFYNNVPLTSIRRAMTTLTDLGYLEKTNQMGDGNYGKLNYKWKLK